MKKILLVFATASALTSFAHASQIDDCLRALDLVENAGNSYLSNVRSCGMRWYSPIGVTPDEKYLIHRNYEIFNDSVRIALNTCPSDPSIQSQIWDMKKGVSDIRAQYMYLSECVY